MSGDAYLHQYQSKYTLNNISFPYFIYLYFLKNLMINLILFIYIYTQFTLNYHKRAIKLIFLRARISSLTETSTYNAENNNENSRIHFKI